MKTQDFPNLIGSSTEFLKLLPKRTKMLQHINKRMRVTIQDGRQLVGTFIAFDHEMNLALGQCEEFRKLRKPRPLKQGKNKNEEREIRRTLGFVLLRGDEIVAMTVEGPPAVERCRATIVGPSAMEETGVGRAAGRGIPTAQPLVQAQPGLAGPVRGIGGPAPDMMQPQIIRPPQLSSLLPMTYPAPMISRPPVQIQGFPGQQQQMSQPPYMQQFRPPGPPYHMPLPPPRPMQPPQQMMRGPPPPPRPGMFGLQPPRPGMPPPPGRAIPTFGPPRPGMPPPPQQQQLQ